MLTRPQSSLYQPMMNAFIACLLEACLFFEYSSATTIEASGTTSNHQNCYKGQSPANVRPTVIASLPHQMQTISSDDRTLRMA